jgi:hypothetical protein
VIPMIGILWRASKAHKMANLRIVDFTPNKRMQSDAAKLRP